MKDIKSLTFHEISDYFSSLGEPKFRAGQVFAWLHERQVTGFGEMSDLKKDLRERLSSEWEICTQEVKLVKKSKDGTQKFLLSLKDGNLIETVLMKYQYGYSLCVSTQVGCGMGCIFCASGKGGFIRNLTPGEILEEVYSVSRNIDGKISRIVFMGMGEPLLNYDNVLSAIGILCDEKGMNLSQRHITLSTCGIVPGIRALADSGIPLTLALSLHGADQETRAKIMPKAAQFPLEEVIGACDYYREKTGRRVTYEYCLIEGVNDRDLDVKNLSSLIKGDAHLNIIPYHSIGEADKVPGDPEEFKKKLEKKGINVTIRRGLGQDIDGACGQLRLREI